MRTFNFKSLKIRRRFSSRLLVGRFESVSCGRCANCRDSIRQGYLGSFFCLRPRLIWTPF